VTRPNRREALAVAGLAASGFAPATGGHPTALVRLSVLGDEAFAPTEAGNLVRADYDPAKRVGRLGRLTAPELAPAGSSFRGYVEDSVRARAPRLGAGPVVVLVHGFLADPREDVRPDAPQRTNNPHDFSYHYSAGPGPYWLHTASWLRGLGFAEGDGGAAGLAVAFGWNSTPDLLTRGLGAALAAARKRLSWADLATLPTDLLELAAATPDIVAAAKAIPVPMTVGRVRRGVERLDELLTAVEAPLARLGDRLPDLYREPYERADLAAWVLVNTVRSVAAALPDSPIDFFCHSLGSRVVVQALHRMAAEAQKPEGGELKTLLGRVGRVVIVGGAEYTTPARRMLAAVRAVHPAGPSVYNFMARRDRILGLLAQRFHPVDLKLRRVVGLCGLTPGEQDPDWVDLQLDADPDGTHPLNAWLRPRKLSVSGVHLTGVLNHWHYFTDERNMDVFEAILRDRGAWAIARLRREGIPERAGVVWPQEP
jgi:hypothetical protein